MFVAGMQLPEPGKRAVRSPSCRRSQNLPWLATAGCSSASFLR